MASYLYAVQDQTGHELISWEGEVEKVSDVNSALEDGGRTVTMNHPHGTSSAFVEDGRELTLYRWASDDKLNRPVAHEVRPEKIEET